MNLIQTETPCSAEEARDLTDRIKASVEHTWSLLLEAHERQAWAVLGYLNWEQYVRGEFDMARRTSYQLLDQGRVIRALNEAAVVRQGAQIVNVTEREARDIKPLLPQVIEGIRGEVATIPDATPERIQEIVHEQVERARAEVQEQRQHAALVAELTPADFDPRENADLVAERGAFFRLCRDIQALGDPEEFLSRQRPHIRADRIQTIEGAYVWLHDFLALWREQ